MISKDSLKYLLMMKENFWKLKYIVLVKTINVISTATKYWALIYSSVY